MLRDRTELISICQRTGRRLKTLPAFYQLANGEVSVKKVRDVDIVDLLGRATVDVDMSGIADYIKGKTVLVTGGGGKDRRRAVPPDRKARRRPSGHLRYIRE